jgi:hypothetical protein
MYTMLQKWISRSRGFSIWSLVAAMTLGLLAACGGDGGSSTTTPTATVPTAPQSVTAVATPSATESVTITWAEPTSGQPILSYNVYRSTTPGVASSLATATLIDSVTSPYVDLVPTGGIPYYYVVTAVNAVG